MMDGVVGVGDQPARADVQDLGREALPAQPPQRRPLSRSVLGLLAIRAGASENNRARPA